MNTRSAHILGNPNKMYIVLGDYVDISILIMIYWCYQTFEWLISCVYLCVCSVKGSALVSVLQSTQRSSHQVTAPVHAVSGQWKN